jgi:beta-lactamase class A
MILFLAIALAALAQQFDGVIGVAAVDIDTGRHFELRADEPFPMASVFKLPIALTVIDKKLPLDERITITPDQFSRGWSPIAAAGKTVTLTVRELLDSAVAQSDNTACDVLLRRAGGPAVVTSHMRELGITGLRVDRPENDIGTFAVAHPLEYASDPRDTSTPAAMVKLLAIIHRRANPLLLGMMLRSVNTHRIAAGVPAKAIVKHKSGTMPGTLNDVAIVTSYDAEHHILMAIFTKGSRMKDEAPREKIVADIARQIYAQFTR